MFVALVVVLGLADVAGVVLALFVVVVFFCKILPYGKG